MLRYDYIFTLYRNFEVVQTSSTTMNRIARIGKGKGVPVQVVSDSWPRETGKTFFSVSFTIVILIARIDCNKSRLKVVRLH